MQKEEYHIPVMLNECMEGLNIKPDGIYIDLTFGDITILPRPLIVKPVEMVKQYDGKELFNNL